MSIKNDLEKIIAKNFGEEFANMPDSVLKSITKCMEDFAAIELGYYASGPMNELICEVIDLHNDLALLSSDSQKEFLKEKFDKVINCMDNSINECHDDEKDVREFYGICDTNDSDDEDIDGSDTLLFFRNSTKTGNEQSPIDWFNEQCGNNYDEREALRGQINSLLVEYYRMHKIECDLTMGYFSTHWVPYDTLYPRLDR